MENPIKKCVLHSVQSDGAVVDLYPRTNLASVADMTAFARTLNGATDAATARNTLGIQTSKDIINIIYPVGSVITLTNDTDPNELYQGTTWVKMEAGRVLVSAGEYTESGFSHTYTLGEKGGEAKHQLTTEELPFHNHSASASTTSLTGSVNSTNDVQGIFNAFTVSASGVCRVTGACAVHTGASGTNGNHHDFYIDASHDHIITVGNTGGGKAQENRSPYESVLRWKRTG